MAKKFELTLGEGRKAIRIPAGARRTPCGVLAKNADTTRESPTQITAKVARHR